jgi:hypothetical protein
MEHPKHFPWTIGWQPNSRSRHTSTLTKSMIVLAAPYETTDCSRLAGHRNEVGQL